MKALNVAGTALMALVIVLIIARGNMTWWEWTECAALAVGAALILVDVFCEKKQQGV